MEGEDERGHEHDDDVHEDEDDDAVFLPARRACMGDWMPMPLCDGAREGGGKTGQDGKWSNHTLAGLTSVVL